MARRESRNDRLRKVKEELSNLQNGEFIKPTPFARERVGISQPTLKPILDEIRTWIEFVKENPTLVIIRDKNGNYREIGKGKDNSIGDVTMENISKLLDKKLEKNK